MLIVWLFFFTTGTEEHAATIFNQQRAQSRQLYKEGKFEELLAVTQKLHLAQPGHIPTLFNLALANALLGNSEAGVAALAKCAEMSLVVQLPKGEAFETVNTLAQEKLGDRFQQLSQPLGKADIAFQYNRPDFFPEAVVYDEKLKAWLLSSVHQREIVRYSAEGRVSILVPSGTNGLLSVLGMAIDNPRRQLWAASSGLPQSRDLPANLHGTAALYCFNADTGATLGHFALDGKGHNLGDLVLDKAGNVYASDGTGGTIYKLALGERKLMPFVSSPWFASPQGLCFSEDESVLYVADYTFGLMMVDMVSREVTQLKAEKPFALSGTDGLVRSGNSLIGIQNAYRPHRVMRWSLAPDGRSIVRSEVILANHPEFDEPTLGTVVGNHYFLVANSQWGKYGKDHLPLPKEQLSGPTILKLDLGQ